MNKSESKYFNTAKRFDKALLTLLEKKQFEYITISEICEEAKVNRSTFYLHYENTRDLLEETARYVFDGFLSYFSVENKNVAEEICNCELQDLYFINEKYLFPYLSYIRDNCRVFATVLSQPMTFSTEDVFRRLFDNIFNPILERFGYPKGERKYVMRFYLNGLAAIITEWLKDGCEKSIEEISQIMHNCIFGRDTKGQYGL